MPTNPTVKRVSINHAGERSCWLVVMVYTLLRLTTVLLLFDCLLCVC